MHAVALHLLLAFAVSVAGLQQEHGGNQPFLACAIDSCVLERVVQGLALTLAAFLEGFQQVGVLVKPAGQSAVTDLQCIGCTSLGSPFAGGFADHVDSIWRRFAAWAARAELVLWCFDAARQCASLGFVCAHKQKGAEAPSLLYSL